MQEQPHTTSGTHRVGMQEARLQQLDEVAVEQQAAQPLHILGAALAQLLPLHPGHDQHLAAGEVRVDLRDQDAYRSAHVHTTTSNKLASCSAAVFDLLTVAGMSRTPLEMWLQVPGK